jgi:hypothetical protein
VYSLRSGDEIRDYAVCQKGFLMSIMPGLRGIPSADPFARIAAKMDVRRLDRVALNMSHEFLDMATTRGPGRPRRDAALEVIAIDGKTLRGSGKHDVRSPVHIVNVLCRGMVILCVRVPEKSNEIGAYDGLINSLHQRSILKGRVITADSLGCQVKAAEHLTSLGAYYFSA